MIASTAIENHVASRKALIMDTLARSVKYADSDIREQLELLLTRALVILDSMQVAFDGIRKNQHLSDKGQWEQIRQLAADILGALDFFFVAAKEADVVYTRAYSQLLAIPAAATGRSELATLIREQEIRTWLRTQPLYTVMFAFIEAVRTGDQETQRAIRTAPGAPLLPEVLIERVVKDHITQTAEQRMIRVQSLDILRGELRDVSHMLKGWLEGYREVKVVTPPITPVPNAMVTR